MQVYDVIMLLVLAGAIIFGAWKGLAWQVASLASIFVSYYVAYEFREPLAARISAEHPWNIFLAMLILYLGTSLVIWLAFRAVSQYIDRLKLKEFDRHTGAVMGAAKGVALCVIITLFGVTLLGENQKNAIFQSHSGYYIAILLDKAHMAMPDELHDVLEPHIHSLDGRLDAGYTSYHDLYGGGSGEPAAHGHHHDDGSGVEHTATTPGSFLDSALDSLR